MTTETLRHNRVKEGGWILAGFLLMLAVGYVITLSLAAATAIAIVDTLVKLTANPRNLWKRTCEAFSRPEAGGSAD